MKRLFIIVGMLNFVVGCQIEQTQEETTTIATTITALTETSEATTIQAESSQRLIYTALEILEWQNPKTVLEMGLVEIVQDLKSQHLYIDAKEYLFYIETVVQDERYLITVKENYADQQITIAQYQIIGEQIERVELTESEEEE